MNHCCSLQSFENFPYEGTVFSGFFSFCIYFVEGLNVLHPYLYCVLQSSREAQGSI